MNPSGKNYSNFNNVSMLHHYCVCWLASEAYSATDLAEPFGERIVSNSKEKQAGNPDLNPHLNPDFEAHRQWTVTSSLPFLN